MLSPETCLKLKEAGWPQWEMDDLGYPTIAVNDFQFAYFGSELWGAGHINDGGTGADDYTCACPTLEELLETLVANFSPVELFFTQRDNGESGWTCEQTLLTSMNGLWADPSEACAALWLKLKGATDGCE